MRPDGKGRIRSRACQKIGRSLRIAWRVASLGIEKCSQPPQLAGKKKNSIMTKNNYDDEDLLTAQEVCQIIGGITPKTLRDWNNNHRHKKSLCPLRIMAALSCIDMEMLSFFRKIQRHVLKKAA